MYINDVYIRSVIADRQRELDRRLRIQHQLRSADPAVAHPLRHVIGARLVRLGEAVAGERPEVTDASPIKLAVECQV